MPETHDKLWEMPPLLYHHSCELSTVKHHVITPNPLSQTMPTPNCPPGHACPLDVWHEKREYELAYFWLEKEIGFYPLFLAVGATVDDKRMTGYSSQFADDVVRGKTEILFSYCDQPSKRLVFTNYDMWIFILNEALNSLESFGGGRHTEKLGPIPDNIRRSLFRPSWRDSDWLRGARRGSHGVQAVVDSLDLRQADQIWCPDEVAKEKLIKLGFLEKTIRIHYLKPWH